MMPWRGAVAIHYDDSLAPFHCPHCGQEFFADDALCIACGFEFADERHPYRVLLRRPAPLLDTTGLLDPAAHESLATALQSAGQQCGMELLLAIFPPELNRPPEEIAWFYANAWELGGVTSTFAPSALPPQETGALVRAALGELLLLPWTLLKSLLARLGQALHPPPAPAQRGLLIAVFPHWRTITLEPTIAAEPLLRWDDPALHEALRECAAAHADPHAAPAALVRLISVLPGFCPRSDS